MKKYTFVLLLSCINLINVYSQNKDYYNFKFARDIKIYNGWMRYFPTAWTTDNSQIVNDKHPLKIFKTNPEYFLFGQSIRYMSYENVVQFPYRFNIPQTIFLPLLDKKSDINISIYTRSLLTDHAWLGIAGFNKDEEMIYVDSLNILTDGSWQTHSLTFPSSGIKYLKLDIRGDGHSVADSLEQGLWIDRMEMTIDGKDFYDYPLLNDAYIDNGDRLSLNKLIPLTSLNTSSLKKINSYQDKGIRIIGFGECAHGSEEISRTIWEHIRYLIEKCNCKAVLLEKGMDAGLKFDLYVRGLTPDSTIRDITEDLRQYKISIKATIHFMQWLREYNKTQEKPVRLLGIDNLSIPFVFLTEYLTLLHPKRYDKTFFEILKSISKMDYERFNNLLTSDSLTKEKLSEFDYGYLMRTLSYFLDERRYFNDTLNAINYEYKYVERRDWYMAENAKWVIENYLDEGEKVALYTHNGHVQKLPLFSSRYAHIPSYSLGEYLAQEYHSSYFVIGTQVGGGEFQQTSGLLGTQGTEAFDVPLFNTFEYAALQTNKDYFFYYTKDIPASILYLRYIPNSSHRNQFRFLAIGKRYDGLLFIKESKAIDNGVKLGISHGINFRNIRKQKIKEFLENLEKASTR